MRRPDPPALPVIITGGTGLIGALLVRRLLSEHRVANLDLTGDPHSPAEFDFVSLEPPTRSDG